MFHDPGRRAGQPLIFMEYNALKIILIKINLIKSKDRKENEYWTKANKYHPKHDHKDNEMKKTINSSKEGITPFQKRIPDMGSEIMM